MKLSNSYFYTIRENIKDEESKSGNLLVRSGLIKKASNGIYMYMPLGIKVLKNIESIVREEMNKEGAQELLMPSLLPEDVYVASGRRENFGKNMFGLKDRYNRNYVLGPTHEELFVIAADQMISSYKDMPFNLYQIGKKYRDEPRPRFGLIRIREFIMKDAYSFDTDYESLDKSYNKMFEAYKRIFNRMGITYKIVSADTGTMGGLLSEEFQAITSIGEDTLVLCSKCDYASNLEVSNCNSVTNESNDPLLEKELVHTPNAGTIEDVANYLNIEASKFVKTLIYKGDNNFYACLIPGDRDVNELKLTKLLNVKELELAQLEDVEKITSAKVGFAGPIDLNIPIIIDNDIVGMSNYIVGANQTDYHYINVNNNDFKYSYKADIKNVKEGDLCPKCKEPLIFKKGMEIGNTFKLGTKYSKDMELYYLDADNQQKPVVMGCYGIGIERIMAAIAEQTADDRGLNWPSNIAPFKVSIVVINSKDSEQVRFANEIYDSLTKLEIETILDDRDERAGVKFNDMDLIGIPFRIIIGKKLIDDLVELKIRKTDEVIDLKTTEVVDRLKEILK
jgi:prolyl-tRNA synthetase